MEHVVFYTGPDRAPAFRRTPSLDEAVRFVESLRNGEGIDDSKVYSLTEVPLRFQTYYRVEVPADVAAAATPGAPPPPAPAAEQLAPPSASAFSAPPPAAPESLAPPEPPAAPEVEVVPPPPHTPEPVFEPVAVGEVGREAAAAPEALGDTSASAAGTESESGEGSSNGKPNRGLGFFAR